MLKLTQTRWQTQQQTRRQAPLPARQRGVTLMIALIMLVAMTLAALALVRSVNITNIVAGNLAFQQGATNAGDRGLELAINWLETNNVNNTLFNSVAAQGYSAIRQDPAVGQSWDTFWRTVLANQAVTINPANPAATIAYTNSAPNAAGNTVSFAIQRMCPGLGAPATGNVCSQPAAVISTDSSSKGAGVVALEYGNQVYYRVTTRIVGPRNTVSYVQALIAL
jgi:type IV pilus assembly protein PilX